MVHYAVFPGDEYFHLTSAGGYFTVCGRRTKGRRVKVPVREPPARVSAETPPPSYLPCGECYKPDDADGSGEAEGSEG